MKIGIQILAYNCVEAFPIIMEPWIKLKKEFNFDFWVGSGQFKIYQELGYEDLNKGTVELLKTEYANIIDHLFIPDSDNLLSDHEMRSQSIEYFEEKGVDLIWILDADEFYMEDEICRVVKFITSNSQYDYYNISLKNYIGDGKLWTDFEPVRLFWTKRYGGVKEHYFDNHFSYKDGSEYRSRAGITIPKEEAFPLHYSWTDNKNIAGSSSLKKKIEYQKKYYADGCGYEWNEEYNKATFSEGNSTEVYPELDFKKYIILSPTCSGKTWFINNCRYWYRGMRLFCGEYESTSRNYVNNRLMGGSSCFLPESHPLYLNWHDIYKLGVESFYKIDWNFSSVLFYNMPSHISYLRKKFPDIEIKVALPDEELHKKMFMKKCEANKNLEKRLIDLIKEESEILHYTNYCYNWKRILDYRDEYTRLAGMYEVPIYDSVESAVQSIFKNKE